MTNKKTLRSTKDLVDRLRKNNEVWELSDPVDPNLELAQLQREVCKRNGPAILFTNVKGTRFPVATNLYGTPKRIELAFGNFASDFIKNAAETAMNIMPPTASKLWAARGLAGKFLKIGIKRKGDAPVFRNRIDPVDLGQLPQIKSWPRDGGAFITFPLVYTENPKSGKGNLGMYRVQLFNKNEAGAHIQIHRGGGYHYFEAERQNITLPVRVFVGGPPAMTISAIAPLPEDIPELLFASLLMGGKIKTGNPDKFDIPMVLDADFSIQGHIQPHVRRPEGPFGDHFGYYSQQHEYPFFKVVSIFHRSDAIFPATIVGIPPQEDHYIGDFLQDLLSPLYPLLMPNVSAIWAYGESGVHALAGAIIKERYPKEAFGGAIRILGEGQLSLTKVLMVTDQQCDIKNFRIFLQKVLERIDFKTDLFVLSNISQDTLDYTGPKVNEGSKAIFLGVGEKKRNLVEKWEGKLFSNMFSEAILFCPGVLCVKGVPYSNRSDLAEELKSEPDLKKFSLVVLLDDPRKTCESDSSFLWHVFTRFEPAADFYGQTFVDRFHISIDGPLIIDCRLKPWYPPVVEDSVEVAKAVQEKWGSKIDQVCRRG